MSFCSRQWRHVRQALHPDRQPGEHWVSVASEPVNIQRICTQGLSSVRCCCDSEGTNLGRFSLLLNLSPSHLNTSVTCDRGEKNVCLRSSVLTCRLPPPNRQAKRLLNEIVEQCRYGPGFHCDMDGNGSIQQILIPANKVGLVIGKKGETIKQLQVWDVTAFTVSRHIFNIFFSHCQQCGRPAK